MKKNLVTSLLLLLGASVSVAVGEEMNPKRFLSPRDAMPIKDMFMNGVMAKAKVKRDLLTGPVINYAAFPNDRGLEERSLEARQWGCESVGQINCVFKGCCSQGTVCGTYGGEQGCCPVGKTCSGVGSCKTTEITCGSGCCPQGARCTVDTDGSDACDYSGTSSVSVKSATSTSSGRAPSSTSSGLSCPANYSPCTGTEYCCPAGVKCLPNLKCDTSCDATDPICGTGCCKSGFSCDSLTSTCFQSEDGGSGSGGSSSTRRTSSRATTSSTRPSSTPPAAATTTSGSGSGSGSGPGSGTNGLGGTSGASSLVVSMGITVLVGVLGIAML